MKRPLGCACLFFILFISSFYILFPPCLPDYSAWQGRDMYVGGQVKSIKMQEINGEIKTVYLLDEVSIDENRIYSNSKDNLSTIYVHQKIYCYSNISNSQIYIGSYVWFKGEFQAYEEAQNPGQFDSRFYYHVQNIGGSLWESEVIWCNGEQNPLLQALHNLKLYFSQKIDSYYQPKYGSVMKAVLLGDKTDLDSEMKALFQEGGILHILTISGLHVSMLGMGCFRVLRKCGMWVRPAAITGLLLVILYGMMIGSGAATLRAVCMFAMQMTAILAGRTYDRLTGLSVAAMMLLLEQPMYVFYSGFLLSFGAILGITIVTPLVEKILKGKGRHIERIGKTCSGGIGILAATFPIQLYFYYEYPLYSMLVNIIVVPFLTIIVGAGALVLVIPEIVGVAAVPLVYICQVLLWGYEQMCLLVQKFPFHCLVLGAPTWWQILLYYVCLVAGIYGLKEGNWKPVKSIAVAGMIVAFFVLLIRPNHEMTFRFLSVGQGDCTVVQYGKETYVVDCGSTSEKKVAKNILLPCLKYYGIAEVSGVFISHADEDHMNGVLQWLMEYEHSHVKIGCIILPDLTEEGVWQEFEELLLLAEKLDIPVMTLSAGDVLQLEKLAIAVMNPPQNYGKIEDANAYSQVLLFDYIGTRVLMTGDIDAETEEKLISKVPGIAVLKAAHHGSKYSNSTPFLQAACPKHIILSYGVGNSYGHPHTDAVARMKEIGANLWYTGRQGAIMVEIGEQVEVWSWCQPD